MLARILQDEYGEDPRCAQDAEIARILQLEYDTNFLVFIYFHKDSLWPVFGESRL